MPPLDFANRGITTIRANRSPAPVGSTPWPTANGSARKPACRSACRLKLSGNGPPAGDSLTSFIPGVMSPSASGRTTRPAGAAVPKSLVHQTPTGTVSTICVRTSMSGARIGTTLSTTRFHPRITRTVQRQAGPAASRRAAAPGDTTSRLLDVLPAAAFHRISSMLTTVSVLRACESPARNRRSRDPSGSTAGLRSGNQYFR